MPRPIPLIIIPLLLCAGVAVPSAAQTQRIAVLEFEGDGSIETSGLRFLADVVREAALQNLDEDWEVVTRDNMLVLLEANAEDLDQCEGECEVETGRLLGAHRVVAGSQVKFGSAYELVLRSYDTESGRLIGSETVSAGDLDELRSLLGPASVRLFGGHAPESPTQPAGRGEVELGVRLDRGGSIVNELTDETGFLVVRTEPEDATIFVNGEEVGRGTVQLEKMVGQYVVVAELGSLYHPAREEIELGTDGARVTLELASAFGSLRVTSMPPGAEVWLAGRKVGRTPWEALRHRSGTFEMRLALEDYHDHTERIEVLDGEDTAVQAELRPAFGTLRITSEPEGAEVWLDGERVGTTPWADQRYVGGSYELRVAMVGYLSHTETVTVKEGQLTKIRGDLKPNFGRLSVRSTPSNAHISLNGENTGLRTPHDFLQVAVGVAEVRLQLDGYGEAVALARVERGGAAVVSEDLEPKLVPDPKC